MERECRSNVAWWEEFPQPIDSTTPFASGYYLWGGCTDGAVSEPKRPKWDFYLWGSRRPNITHMGWRNPIGGESPIYHRLVFQVTREFLTTCAALGNEVPLVDTDQGGGTAYLAVPGTLKAMNNFGTVGRQMRVLSWNASMNWDTIKFQSEFYLMEVMDEKQQGVRAVVPHPGAGWIINNWYEIQFQTYEDIAYQTPEGLYPFDSSP